MPATHYSITANSSRNIKNGDAFEDIKRLFCFGTFFKKTTPYIQKTLADKIAEPSKIQEMKRIYTTPDDPLEEQTIDKFLHFYYCLPQDVLPMPHTNTFAMSGRPMFSQIKMSNGLFYLAAISEIGEISWFKSIDGKVSGFNPADHSVAEIKQMVDRREIFPTGDLNRNYYKILLYPYYEDGKIREDDFLAMGLKKDVPLDSKEPIQLDNIIFSSRKSSFDIFRKYIDEDKVIGLGTFFPPHLLKVFKKLETFYEVQKPTLGQMIYTLFSPKDMGTTTPLSSNSHEIHFYNTEVVNPNIATKVSSKPLFEIPYPLANEKQKL